MSDPDFIQAFILPVATGVFDGHTYRFQSMHGTAFMIGSGGIFLSAVHVFEEARAFVDKNNGHVALIGMKENGRREEPLFLAIKALEQAPSPFDIVVGKVDYSPQVALVLKSVEVRVLADVSTFGYPHSAMSGSLGLRNIGVRSQRGYIQRRVAPGEIDPRLGEHPEGFELSFNVSAGMSGSPIFLSNVGWPSPVIGVAVSSFRGETTESEFEEIEEDGTIYREKRLRIEEFGLAHDINPLLNWRPDIGCGKTLLELASS